MHELVFHAVGQGQGPGAAGCANMGIMTILMFGVLYMLVLRPQQKRQREHQAMISRLKKGDKVITAGGIIGTITGLTDAELEIAVADKVRIKVLRPQVMLYQSTPGADQNSADSKDGK